MKKVALHNLGCKVNAYETEAMQEMLEKEGYEIVPFKEGADIYIINTCTVTNIADRKSRQMLHRARKMNPNAIVVAAGCYVQAQENEHHELDQRTGWMQSVLFRLYYSGCKRPRAQSFSGRCSTGSNNIIWEWLQGSCSYMNSSEFLWS